MKASASDVPLNDAGEVMWAIDLDGTGRWPEAAHQIVSAYRDRRGEVRVSACGREFTEGTHPRGWWSSPPGKAPMADIHCHADLTAGG